MQTNSRSQIARAIDVGYGHVKYSIGESSAPNGEVEIPCGSFPSLPVLSTRNNTDDASNTRNSAKLMSIEVGGQKYLISANPEMIAVPSHVRSAGENYVGSQFYRVCMAAAIKLMRLPYPRIDHLVLGTPVGNFDAAKKMLLENFSRGIEFDDQKIEIGQIYVARQPLGGLLYQYRRNGHEADLSRYTRLVIDVGYGTLDWVVARGLVPNHDRSGSSPHGVERLVNAIYADVCKPHGSISANLPINEDIDRMLQGTHSDFFFRGKSYHRESFDQLVNGIIDQGLETVFRKVSELNDIHSIVLVGGLAKLYAHRVKATHPDMQVEIVGTSAKESRFGNVRGFQLIAERQLRASTDNK